MSTYRHNWPPANPLPPSAYGPTLIIRSPLGGLRSIPAADLAYWRRYGWKLATLAEVKTYKEQKDQSK